MQYENNSANAFSAYRAENELDHPPLIKVNDGLKIKGTKLGQRL